MSTANQVFDIDDTPTSPLLVNLQQAYFEIWHALQHAESGKTSAAMHSRIDKAIRSLECAKKEMQ